jgi:hypothetical protein
MPAVERTARALISRSFRLWTSSKPGCVFFHRYCMWPVGILANCTAKKMALLSSYGCNQGTEFSGSELASSLCAWGSKYTKIRAGQGRQTALATRGLQRLARHAPDQTKRVGGQRRAHVGPRHPSVRSGARAPSTVGSCVPSFQTASGRLPHQGSTTPLPLGSPTQAGSTTRLLLA